MLRIVFLTLSLLASSVAMAAAVESLLFDEQDLVISSTESKRALGKAPAIVTVLTEKQLRDMGAHSLLQALQAVPGLNIAYAPGIASGHVLSVRGIKTGESEKILLLINGHRVNNPYSGSWSYLFDEFLLDDVRRIEVIRGPGSALYGSNAMSAVIQVFTRTANEARGADIRAGVGSQSYSAGHLTLAAESASGVHALFSASASSQQPDRRRIVQDIVGARGSSNFWRKQQQGFLSLEYQAWSLFAMHIQKRRGSILDLTNYLDTSSDIKVQQSFARLSWSHEAEQWDMSWNVDGDLFQLEPYWQGFGGGLHMLAPVRNLTLSSGFLARYRGWEQHEWTVKFSYDWVRQFGVQTYRNGVDITATQNHNRAAKRRVPSVVVQDEWQPLQQLNITAGLRAEMYSDVGSHVSPRLAGVWAVNESFDVKAMYGHAFRAPNFIELYSANNPSIVGNPQAKPETVDTFETGFLYHQGQWHLDANVFYSRYRNMLTRQAGRPLTVNIGRAHVQGAEFSLGIDVQKDMYASLFYAYQQGRNEVTKQDLAGVPQHSVRLSADTALARSQHLHADLLWLGTQKRALGDPRAVVPASYVVNAAWRLDDLFDSAHAELTVQNLFDQVIVSPMASPAMADIPMSGRQWQASLSWVF